MKNKALTPNSKNSNSELSTKPANFDDFATQGTGKSSRINRKKDGHDGGKKNGGLAKYLRPHLILVALAVLFSIIYVAAQLFVPIFVGRAIDAMDTPTGVNFDTVFANIIILMALVAVAVLFHYLTGVLGTKAAHSAVADMRSAAFNKINRVPLNDIDTANRGDLVHRVILDADRVAEGLISGFTSLFSGAVTIVGTLVLMLRLDVYVALAVLGLTPFSVLTAFLIAKLAQKMFTRQISAEGRLSSHSEEYLSNQRLVKLFTLENAAEQKFGEINQEINAAGSKAVFYSALVNPSTRLVSGLVHVVVCILGALLIVGGRGLTVGELSVFLIYALQYAKPFNEISTIVTELQIAMVSAKRLGEILQKSDESADAHLPPLLMQKTLQDCDSDSTTDSSGAVCFKSVDFAYGNKPFIQSLDLTAKAGEHVAIVGRTGCGKTTIISLLMRFYDLDGGSICIDNKDISAHTRSSVRANIGMVLQDSWLFSGTAHDNIAYGRGDATRSEVREAAEKAGIDRFIQRLPLGYDTILVPESLSAGQMQLLCIARVFLARPQIVILDEATSNIDARTELKIQRALKEMTAGCTSFIVAHRLSTIKGADKIVVMDGGKVVECGTHQQLEAQNGKYAEMLSALSQ